MDAVGHSRSVLRRFEEINTRLGEPIEDAEMEKLLAEQATVQDEIDAKNLWDLDRQVEIAMDAMNLPPADWAVTNLSGGERRRVALCKLLLEKPDLLLLDEPTNHLDAESVNWLERHLAEYTGTVVAVTHDRYFLDNVAKWILEVDHGRGIPFEGNYTSWLRAEEGPPRDGGEAGEHPSEDARQGTRVDSDVAQGPAGQEQGPRGSYEKLAAEQAAVRDSEIEIFIPASRSLGDQVIDVDNISKAFGDKLLFENLVVQTAAGRHRGHHRAQRRRQDHALPDARGPGEARQRHDQGGGHGRHRLRRPKPRRPRSRQDGVRGDLGRPRHDRTRQADGQLPAATWRSSTSWAPTSRRKVGTLSGGERNRVHLAKLLRGGANLLLLDEPTNDLDVDTLRSLEEGISSFAGSVVVITHDRWFLDRLATHIIAFEGDGYVHVCEGNFEVYERSRKERLGVGADEPHRFRHKKLTH
jgi:energy-dependent translational throttle protein EttA